MSDFEDAATRNQVFLEGLKTQTHNDFDAYLRRIDKLVRERLAEEGETIGTKKALNSLLADIKRGQVDIYGEYNSQLTELIEELAIDQTDFEARSINNAVIDVNADIPTNNVVLAALRNNPMQVQGYNGTPLLAPFIRDLTENQIGMVTTRIRQGYAQGRTTDQITRDIRGTKKNRYRDGELARITRSNRALVFTTLQHASTQGRVETMRRNDDIITGYEWLSTLDGHTSQICRSLDGKTYEYGNGPLPPIHINCRSTILEVVDPRYNLASDLVGDRPSSGAGGAQQVSANTTYYAWLKRQPASFQNSAIGPNRGALLRNGGISGDEFAELSLGKNFRPLTLDQMRELRPEIFERANL